MNTTQEPTTDTNTPEPQTAIPKYAIILKFWNTPQEIEVIDYVHSINKKTHQGFVKFFDSAGRYWSVPEPDVIIVKNFPEETDIKEFQRLKREVAKLEKDLGKEEKIEYCEVG